LEKLLTCQFTFVADSGVLASMLELGYTKAVTIGCHGFLITFSQKIPSISYTKHNKSCLCFAEPCWKV